MKIPIHRVDSVAGEVDAMQKRIATRAEELHEGREGGLPLDDWLVAEREVIWRPALDVRQSDDSYVVEAAVAGLEPRQIDVRVAPNDVLIAADVHHDHGRTADVLLCEFNAGPLFRSYHFDRPIDPERVTADYKNGLLRITAPLAPGPTP